MNLFDKKICRLTFTHTDYSDLWSVYFGEMKKYFNIELNHFICVNYNVKNYTSFIPKSTKVLLYDDKFKYSQRLRDCLNQLKNYKYVFFDHEDMFLFSKPNYKKLSKYYEFIKDEKFDSIRLIKDSHSKVSRSKYDNTLYEIANDSKWNFSIQPSIWSIEKLLKILNENLNCNPSELENKSQKVVKNMKLKIAYSHDNSKKRGQFHYDNKVYPYIATAINKGKWNTSEYSVELEKIFNKYLINSKLRGEV
jgi:hypothetical protein